MTSQNERGDAPMWIVIEDAYKTPTVNGQKYMHTVAAEDVESAICRVTDAIRSRLDGEGRKLLDDGLNLTVIPWAAVETRPVRDRVEIGGVR
jgi:hypothetical protein